MEPDLDRLAELLSTRRLYKDLHSVFALDTRDRRRCHTHDTTRLSDIRRIERVLDRHGIVVRRLVVGVFYKERGKDHERWITETRSKGDLLVVKALVVLLASVA